MIVWFNVLVDDKQPPVVDHLEDITGLLVDIAPDSAGYPKL
jgi:hypothetical protein